MPTNAPLKNVPFHRRMVDYVAGYTAIDGVDFLLRDEFLRNARKNEIVNERVTAIEQSMIPYHFVRRVLEAAWSNDRAYNETVSGVASIFESVFGDLYDLFGIPKWSLSGRLYAPGFAACDAEAVIQTAVDNAHLYFDEDAEYDAINKKVIAIFDDHAAIDVKSDNEILITQGTVEGQVKFDRALSIENGGFYPTECAISELGVLIPKHVGLPNDLEVGVQIVNKFKSKNKLIVMQVEGDNPASITLDSNQTIVLKHSDLRVNSYKFTVMNREDLPIQPV